jgi:hypothetical protein
METQDYPLYVRTADLALAVHKHAVYVEKCIYTGILQPDAELKHGTQRRPLFLKSKMEDHINAIRSYAHRIIEERTA